jgi:hypothetical protein
VIKAILELKGTLEGVTSTRLLTMSSLELLRLFVELEKAIDGANATEPAPTMD